MISLTNHDSSDVATWGRDQIYPDYVDEITIIAALIPSFPASVSTSPGFSDISMLTCQIAHRWQVVSSDFSQPSVATVKWWENLKEKPPMIWQELPVDFPVDCPLNQPNDPFLLLGEKKGVP
jgi:hypothetical protein